MTTIALGVPHTPWNPDRVKSMARVRAALRVPYGGAASNGPTGFYREFTEREPNHVWSERMWRWAIESGAEFFLTVQDDSLLAPHFIETVQAMIAHLPRGAVLGLMAQHPAGPAVARAGLRWYATRSWAVGPGYGLWREDLVEFLAWRDTQPLEIIKSMGEDALLNKYVTAVGKQTWHPVPTIVQHDLTLETNYEGNDKHDYREASFTWQDWAPTLEPRSAVSQAAAEEIATRLMADPAFWDPLGPVAVLPFPPPKAHVPDPTPLAEVETEVGAISLAISHTPWVPARVESKARLVEQLGGEAFIKRDVAMVAFPKEGPEHYLEMTDRAANAVWSEKMWRWSAETAAEWCLFLQDDVQVPANFWRSLRAMLSALPPEAEVMCLEVVHPAARALAEEGVRWITTCDALIGPGYVVRRSALREFLGWRASSLHPGALAKGGLTEDTMIGMWCMVTGRRVWGPLPTIIDHDTDIASTYGNDEHTNRRPLVRWDTETWEPRAVAHATGDPPQLDWSPRRGQVALELSSFWRSSEPRHLGRFYPMSPEIALRWVSGLTLADHARLKADDGAPVLVGLKHRMLARAYKEPKYKVFLATPYRADGVRPEYAQSVFQLQRLIGIDVQHEMSLDVRQEHDDLVRVRSRMLRIAYEMGEGACTHMLLADGDNAWPAEVVAGMLRTGKDFVQCPYLSRDGRGYIIRPTEKTRRSGNIATDDVQPDGTVEIDHTGLGLTLVSRRCMERMIEHYREADDSRVDLEATRAMFMDSASPSNSAMMDAAHAALNELERWRAGAMGLTFLDLDRQRGTLHPTIGLFDLLVRDGRLLGEDASFATRWRDIGGKVWLYVGQGTPIAHYGSTAYQGRIEDLGLTRARSA